MSGEEQCCCALADACVLFHLEDARAPGAYLSAHVEELCYHGQPEVRVVEQVREMSTITTVFVLAVDRWKFGASNGQRHQQHDAAKHDIGRHHAHDFAVKIDSVAAGCFHLSDSRGGVLHAGEDEEGPY